MQQCHTFHIRNQLASRLPKEGKLTGDGLQHLDEVWQEKDHFHFMVGQVPATADALSALDMWSTQQGHCGPLMHILWSKSMRKTRPMITRLSEDTSDYAISV